MAPAARAGGESWTGQLETRGSRLETRDKKADGEAARDGGARGGLSSGRVVELEVRGSRFEVRG